MMEYKGYIGKVEFDAEDDIFHGHIVNIDDAAPIPLQNRPHNVYTHLGLLDIAGALSNLPSLTTQERVAAAVHAGARNLPRILPSISPSWTENVYKILQIPAKEA